MRCWIKLLQNIMQGNWLQLLPRPTLMLFLVDFLNYLYMVEYLIKLLPNLLLFTLMNCHRICSWCITVQPSTWCQFLRMTWTMTT